MGCENHLYGRCTPIRTQNPGIDDRRIRLGCVHPWEFAAVHAEPESSSDVADEMEARLVVLGPEKSHSSKAENRPTRTAAEEILNRRGNSPRLYRNMLVFLAPDKARLNDLAHLTEKDPMVMLIPVKRESKSSSQQEARRKPPKGLEGAPYIVQNKINLHDLTEPTLIFSGSAIEAIPAFPANINVAAALSIAGIGAVKTIIKIIADPTCDKNTHEIEVEGDFGKLIARTENIPYHC